MSKTSSVQALIERPIAPTSRACFCPRSTSGTLTRASSLPRRVCLAFPHRPSASLPTLSRDALPRLWLPTPTRESLASTIPSSCLPCECSLWVKLRASESVSEITTLQLQWPLVKHQLTASRWALSLHLPPSLAPLPTSQPPARVSSSRRCQTPRKVRVECQCWISL